MAPQGTSHDRIAALERQVASLREALAMLVSEQEAGSRRRWPAAGTTAEEIAAGAVGEVQLVNQKTGDEFQKVRAKNPYATDIPVDTFCTVHVVNGVLLIFTADCPG